MNEYLMINFNRSVNIVIYYFNGAWLVKDRIHDLN